MNEALHTYQFGSPTGREILALHGVTGHGRRWRDMGERQVPEARWIAPDLLGHGASSMLPPWNIEAHLAAVLATLDEYATGPVVVVGHSFGGCLALHLAHSYPERVSGLVLLDPAIGLEPKLMARIAEKSIQSLDYTDAAEALAEKRGGSWKEVPDELMDREMAEHLVELDNGRAVWRYSAPAAITILGELARPVVAPANVIPTVLIQAMRVKPPYVGPALRDALAAKLGDAYSYVPLDVDHMVPMARPAQTAAAVRSVLERS